MIEHTLEDLRWLIETGEHPDRIPARLGCSRYGLARWLRREGHPELAVLFDWKKKKKAT
jgi:hypothetical protein